MSDRSYGKKKENKLNLTYILTPNGNPRVENDDKKWGQWFRKANRHIKFNRIENYIVSTVFLGIDASLGRSKRPILYETLVFKTKKTDRKTKSITYNTFTSLEQYFARYDSGGSAINGHAKIVKELQEDIKNGDVH